MAEVVFGVGRTVEARKANTATSAAPIFTVDSDRVRSRPTDPVTCHATSLSARTTNPVASDSHANFSRCLPSISPASPTTTTRGSCAAPAHAVLDRRSRPHRKDYAPCAPPRHHRIRRPGPPAPDDPKRHRARLWQRPRPRLRPAEQHPPTAHHHRSSRDLLQVGHQAFGSSDPVTPPSVGSAPTTFAASTIKVTTGSSSSGNDCANPGAASIAAGPPGPPSPATRSRRAH